MLFLIATVALALVVLGLSSREGYLQSGKASWTSKLRWQKKYDKLAKKGRKYLRRAEKLRQSWTPITL